MITIEDKMLGKTREEREDYIDNLDINDAFQKEKIYDIGSSTSQKIIKASVFHIPYDIPIYRLSNIRTNEGQQTIIATENLEEDFFSKDPENRAALKKQHEILFKIASQGQDKKNFYQNFQSDVFKDTEPIVITRTGVMVNGNTRMSAVRQLFAEGKAPKNLSTIPMAVLPSTVTEKEIKDLEISLQIVPDWQKEYSWISEALDCEKRLLEEGKLDDVISDYGRKKNDISHPEKLLDQLFIANMYLEQRGLKGNYSKISGKSEDSDIKGGLQYAFDAWAKQRKKAKDDVDLKNIFDVMVGKKVEDHTTNDGSGRLFVEINSFAKNFFENPEAYLTQLSLITKQEKEPEENPANEENPAIEENPTNEENDDFSDINIEADESDTQPKTHITTNEIQNIDSSVVSDIIEVVSESLKQEKKDEKKESSLYTKIQDCEKIIKEAIFLLENHDLNEFKYVEDTKSKLESITKLMEQLNTNLNKDEDKINT